jgi:hypothetical protein
MFIRETKTKNKKTGKVYSKHTLVQSVRTDEGPRQRTLAFDTAGVPLGILHVQCWARDPDERSFSNFRDCFETYEEESQKWLNSFRAVADMQKRLPGVRLISVGDREADFYDLFELADADPNGPGVLVRASHDRKLVREQGKLWEHVASRPKDGEVDVHVPRRGNRKARTATLAMQFCEVTLKPPKPEALSQDPELRKLLGPPKKRKAVRVWAVLAREERPPTASNLSNGCC